MPCVASSSKLACRGVIAYALRPRVCFHLVQDLVPKRGSPLVMSALRLYSRRRMVGLASLFDMGMMQRQLPTTSMIDMLVGGTVFRYCNWHRSRALCA